MGNQLGKNLMQYVANIQTSKSSSSILSSFLSKDWFVLMSEEREGEYYRYHNYTIHHRTKKWQSIKIIT